MHMPGIHNEFYSDALEMNRMDCSDIYLVTSDNKWSHLATHNWSPTSSTAAGVLGACCCPVLAPAEVLRDPAPLDPLVVARVPALGGDSIETFWIEFQLEKSLEFCLEIPYT